MTLMCRYHYSWGLQKLQWLLNIPDLEPHTEETAFCLSGILHISLNDLPFFLGQVSLSLGASVFLGVYLRKPTSKEGSGVYLTNGNLNRDWVKNRGNGSCRATTATINRGLSSTRACNFIHHTMRNKSSQLRLERCWQDVWHIPGKMQLQKEDDLIHSHATPCSSKCCGKC